mmetsp:Transcript_10204/g.23012  ORF Transcript_10204/g.23012 Transcript_10204/m.23012 type:complete len:210 (+) Transcript_10204:497-1126(+)
MLLPTAMVGNQRYAVLLTYWTHRPRCRIWPSHRSKQDPSHVRLLLLQMLENFTPARKVIDGVQQVGDALRTTWMMARYIYSVGCTAHFESLLHVGGPAVTASAVSTTSIHNHLAASLIAGRTSISLGPNAPSINDACQLIGFSGALHHQTLRQRLPAVRHWTRYSQHPLSPTEIQLRHNPAVNTALAECMVAGGVPTSCIGLYGPHLLV